MSRVQGLAGRVQGLDARMQGLETITDAKPCTRFPSSDARLLGLQALAGFEMRSYTYTRTQAHMRPDRKQTLLNPQSLQRAP